MPTNITSLVEKLDDFDPTRRRDAVRALAEMLAAGEVPTREKQPVCNIHAHTFYSYNAYDYSPSMLAFKARQEGIPFMGIIDFDTLDGVDEFLWACDQFNLRGTASMETRTYLPAFAEDVITSPNEPGVTYHILAGFTTSEVPAPAQKILDDLRARLLSRNRRIVTILNAYLSPLHLDFETQVVPLSAGRTPTERHILDAYFSQSQERVANTIRFWAEKLEMPEKVVSEEIKEAPRFKGLIRRKLIKAGGVAYQPADAETYPSLEKIHKLAKYCGALPTVAWLDGTSSGEQREPELLDFMIANGVVALNIIPDRNWNIADPAEQALKIRKLHEVVAMAGERDLPILVGTEMNKDGQKFVDDFNAPALAPVRGAFLAGAAFLYGHTLMARNAQRGFNSDWAEAHFTNRHAKNAFYERIGRISPNTQTNRDLLQSLPIDRTPDDILRAIKQHGDIFDLYTLTGANP
ncbi:hypothetical protein KQH56_01830 [bacterium]|nr:hypothetical protein [bacterium]